MSHFDLNDKIRIDEYSPYNIISHNTVDNLEEFLTKSITRIKTESSPRLIIIETWLMLDFAIRQLIIWGIGADHNSNDNFDLRNKLLPTGFKNCLDFLLTFKKRQEDLIVDPNAKCLKLPIRFWHYIKTELDTTEKVERGVSIGISNTINPTPIEFRTVDEHWLKVVSFLNNDWINKVNQINNVRNEAAHSYNEEKVFNAFGINGSNRTELLRQKCIASVSFLLQVKTIE